MSVFPCDHFRNEKGRFAFNPILTLIRLGYFGGWKDWGGGGP